MFITLEADYAVRIVSVLCREKDKMDAKTISNDACVTLRFALKILRKLVAADIVKSYKGTQGGYIINKDPAQLTLKDVLEAIEGTYYFSRCLSPDCTCNRGADGICCYQKAFNEISEMVRNKLDTYTFAELIANSEEFNREDTANENCSKKFKLDKEAINKIDSEYDDRDLSNYTNYEVYDEEKPRHRFLKKLVKRLIILCAVVLVINLAVLLYTGRLWFNEPKKRDYPIRGPVVTESMGEIRWKSFAKQNIQTAYIRATKGTTFEDGAFRDNWNGSKDTDISVGAYHVLELDTDGTKQAEQFHKCCGRGSKRQAYPCSGGKTERTLQTSAT